MLINFLIKPLKRIKRHSTLIKSTTQKQQGLFKAGFTLAEVLITLGIIGIVAAMTLPTLITKIRTKTLKTQFFKTYAELNESAKLFAQNEGASVHDYSVYTSTSGSTDIVLQKYMTYFKGSTKTGLRGNSFDSAHKITQRNLNGLPHNAYPCDQSGVVMDIKGRLFTFDDPPSAYSADIKFGPKICVDINGISPPNQQGYDRFTFVLTEDNTVVPYTGTQWNTLVPNLTDEEQIKKYCNYTASIITHACAYFALKDKSPDGNGTYWNDFLK